MLGEAFYGVATSLKKAIDGGYAMVISFLSVWIFGFQEKVTTTFSTATNPFENRMLLYSWVNEGGGLKKKSGQISFWEGLILQISLPIEDKDDEVILGLDKQRFFSVKSAYHMGMDFFLKRDMASSSPIHHQSHC